MDLVGSAESVRVVSDCWSAETVMSMSVAVGPESMFLSSLSEISSSAISLSRVGCLYKSGLCFLLHALTTSNLLPGVPSSQSLMMPTRSHWAHRVGKRRISSNQSAGHERQVGERHGDGDPGEEETTSPLGTGCNLSGAGVWAQGEVVMRCVWPQR